MNSIVEYMYRDGSNYKVWEEVVVTGGLSLKDLQPYLMDNLWFFPEAVGLLPLQAKLPGYPACDDHPWHELVDVRPTEKGPGEIDAEALIAAFRDAAEHGLKRTA